MKLKMSLLIAFFGSSVLGFSSCTQAVKKQVEQASVEAEDIALQKQKVNLQEFSTAYFAAGCFWCVEAIFESVEGVVEAESGYAGGTEKDPNYRDVSYGRTGHAEAVKVYYDPAKVSFLQLVQVFFGSHDPTTLNRQGPDRGPQYRSIAFYETEEEQKIILEYLDLLKKSGQYDRPIVTEISPLTKFYRAEDYHQDYERRNPDNSYVQNVSIPRLNRFKANFPDLLKNSAKQQH